MLDRFPRCSRELTNRLPTIARYATCSDSPYHSGVKFTDLGFGLPVLGLQCARVTIENTTFSNVTVTDDTAVVVGESVEGCFAGCKLAGVRFPDNDTAQILAASSMQVSRCICSSGSKLCCSEALCMNSAT